VAYLVLEISHGFFRKHKRDDDALGKQRMGEKRTSTPASELPAPAKKNSGSGVKNSQDGSRRERLTG
jgi:hypothetical protein